MIFLKRFGRSMGISLRRDGEINLDGWHLFGFYRLISGCQSSALDGTHDDRLEPFFKYSFCTNRHLAFTKIVIDECEQHDMDKQ